MERSSSQERRHKRRQKQSKQLKSSHKEQRLQKHNDDRERSRSKEKRQTRIKEYTKQKQYDKQQDNQPQKMFVSCRRCKQMTFSLVNRTCSSCGYPKQSRPAYFPVTKQVQVLDLVRQGKLTHNSYAPVLIEVVVNDRMGKRQRIKCSPSDTILQFKKLISAQIGTRPQKIRLQKANSIFKDHITLEDYQIKDGMGLQMYYD